jgi:hypothetical protein
VPLKGSVVIRDEISDNEREYKLKGYVNITVNFSKISHKITVGNKCTCLVGVSNAYLIEYLDTTGLTIIPPHNIDSPEQILKNQISSIISLYLPILFRPFEIPLILSSATTLNTAVGRSRYRGEKNIGSL